MCIRDRYVCTPSPALTSLTLWQNVWGDVCAPVAGAYVLLRCGEIVVTCAHRWPVLTSYYVVKRCAMMCLSLIHISMCIRDSHKFILYHNSSPCVYSSPDYICICQTCKSRPYISAKTRSSRWGRAGELRIMRL